MWHFTPPPITAFTSQRCCCLNHRCTVRCTTQPFVFYKLATTMTLDGDETQMQCDTNSVILLALRTCYLEPAVRILTHR